MHVHLKTAPADSMIRAQPKASRDKSVNHKQTENKAGALQLNYILPTGKATRRFIFTVVSRLATHPMPHLLPQPPSRRDVMR